ncbi:MAG: HD-GYP domain-containing protein [Limnochordia bacterium]|jgi:putative two-component system response regulator
MDVRPKRFWTLIACIAALPLFYALVWVTGGTHNAWTHLFYLPIIFAALAINWHTSALIAVASGLLLSGWLIPRDTVEMIPQLTSAWVIRLAMFVAVSLWTSVVVDYLRRRADQLYHETVELTRVQHAAVGALADLAEMRDREYTGYHSRRLGHYADVLCTQLQVEPNLHRNIVDTIALHDIGKVAIPDAVLMKPGKLEPHEWDVVKRHPAIGEQILDSICRHAEATSESVLSFLSTAREIVGGHHERYDGTGYPNGLKGDQIPLSARIAAVCDVYDSLRSKRPYKKRFCHETAVQMITKGRGTHFDPKVVDAFLAVQEKFAAIWEQLKEEEATVQTA